MALWLHTDGSLLRDENNRVFKVQGCVLRPTAEGAEWMTAPLATVIEDIDFLLSIGVRSVRIESGEGTWRDPIETEKVDWLHQVLDYMEQVGMRCFLSVHGGDLEDLDVLVNPDTYVPIWTYIANEYKDKSTLVGAGYWNEPAMWYWNNHDGYTEEQFYTMYENLYNKVAQSLTVINPNLLILVGGDFPAVVPFRAPLPYANVVYAFNQHYFAYWYAQTKGYYWGELFRQGNIEEGKHAFLNYLRYEGALRLQNIPLINMEWGFFPEGRYDDPTPEPYWREVAQAMYEVMEENNIGWIGWIWQLFNSNQGSSLMKPGERFVFSEWGTVWRNLITTSTKGGMRFHARR
jgi:hypothetical protein